MNAEATSPRLTVRQADSLLHVGLAGDWIASASLPRFDLIEKEFLSAAGSVKAMEFETASLGRWNSGLMVFVLRCHDLCERNKLEFRAQTLPPGVARLIQLSRSQPEAKDAARSKAHAPFFQRLGESVLNGWAEGIAMLTFFGEILLGFTRLLRRQARFPWADTFLVMQASGPQALGIVALINFLVGLILAFVGATQLERFGASIYTADLVAIATVREMGCIMTGTVAIATRSAV